MRKKCGLFLVPLETQTEEFIGILKKINFEKEAFEKKYKMFCFKFDDFFPFKNFSVINKKYMQYKQTFKFYNEVFNKIQKKNIDFIYIRYGYSHYYFLKFLKKMKIKKIIIEIPSFPYDRELKQNGILQKIKLLMDKMYRRKLKKYVDLIAYIGEMDCQTIYKIPALRIKNGINVQRTIQKKNLKLNKEIVFLGVASLAYWHGFDRLVKSIAQYHNTKKNIEVKFNIVGDGPELQNLIKLTNDLKLSDQIQFYYHKIGKDLDVVYDKCHIGVGSLGAFRKKINVSSELKSREYCAKGIPFIIGCDIDGFDKNVNFIYQVENNDSLFDIEKIIKWYQKNDFKAKEIRKYAEDNLTWDKQLEKVFEFIDTD